MEDYESILVKMALPYWKPAGGHLELMIGFKTGNFVRIIERDIRRCYA
jgi:hypothetical protein